jgi:hypothetical protein
MILNMIILAQKRACHEGTKLMDPGANGPKAFLWKTKPVINPALKVYEIPALIEQGNYQEIANILAV